MKQIDLEGCLIGRFCFKRTLHGNLIGEFSNHKIDIVSTESADAHETSNLDFTGTYNTTWQEDRQPHFATLIISHKAKTSQKIYTLNWKNKDTQIFVGEGFVYEDMLIGDYRDFNIL